MRFAYADPPYLGMAHHYEGGVEVNHRLLIAYLNEFDARALSCHTPSLFTLQAILEDIGLRQLNGDYHPATRSRARSIMPTLVHAREGGNQGRSAHPRGGLAQDRAATAHVPHPRRTRGAAYESSMSGRLARQP